MLYEEALLEYCCIQELVFEWYLVRTEGLYLSRSRYVIADACGFFQRSEAKDHNVKSIDNHLLNTFWDLSTGLKNILLYFISMN